MKPTLVQFQKLTRVFYASLEKYWQLPRQVSLELNTFHELPREHAASPLCWSTNSKLRFLHQLVSRFERTCWASNGCQAWLHAMGFPSLHRASQYLLQQAFESFRIAGPGLFEHNEAERCSAEVPSFNI